MIQNSYYVAYLSNYLYIGSYDKCVLALRDEHKDDIGTVLSVLFSHSQVAKKNQVRFFCSLFAFHIKLSN